MINNEKNDKSTLLDVYAKNICRLILKDKIRSMKLSNNQ